MEGTYRLDASGKPTPLTGKNAKGKDVASKPTLVSIKVYIT